MPDAKLLEAFPTPTATPFVIEHTSDEFTSLCPKTGHPDFGEVTLRYQPAPAKSKAGKQGCVELKSLKLYVWSFRSEGAFHEAVTNRMLGDLAGLLDPRFMRLTAEFNVRGGIYTTIVAEQRQPGWRPEQLPVPPSGA